MLALLGFIIILGVLAGILSKRLSPMVALMTIPFLGALAGGALHQQPAGLSWKGYDLLFRLPQ